VAVTEDGGRVYVTDAFNHRVQYFRVANPAVAPASLGRVKALFR
jgi:DNA-binding beta-propeller fold protein YncE